MGSDAGAAETLPRGRHKLDPGYVSAHQKARLLRAMAEEVADQGYSKTTVDAVVARSRVSKKTFYQLFEDKDDCFLAAFDAAVAVLSQHVTSVFVAMPEPTPERAKAVLAAILETFASEPAFARMCTVEMSSAGPRAVRRYMEMVDSFVPILAVVSEYQATKSHNGTMPPSPVILQAIVGGINSAIYHRVALGETETLPLLLPELTYFLLAPFIGEEAAAAVSLG